MKSSRYNCLLFTCLLLLAFCFLIACAPDISTNSSPSSKRAPVSPEKTTPAPVEGTVTDIVDNNIIKVNIIGTTHTVRYIGIYTLVPYRHSKPLEYYFEECKKKNNELIKDRAIRLEKDISEADKSGRLLRYVWVGDMMVNAELVRQGYAMVLGSPPDIKYYDILIKLQQEAQNEGRGLWPEEKEQLGSTPTPGTFIGNMVSRIYHYASCPLLTNIREQDKIVFFSTNSALAHGYTGCDVCNSPKQMCEASSASETEILPSNSEGRWPKSVREK